MSNFFAGNPFGEQIFKLRYALDENESWEAACRRVSDHVARAEKTEAFTRWRDEFNEELVNGRFMPGGRIWYGSGRNKAQLINCFVVPCADSREGWGKLLYDTTVISGTGGGVGTNFSKTRYRGSIIIGTGGTATGAVSPMRMVNAVGEEIKGGGGRRAAYMFCLNHTHPDIMEFLSAKLDKGQLNNANISIVLMDESPEEFFEKVRNDADHDLVWKGQVVKTVKARDLWNLIVRNALENGEPGILNGHLANQMNNLHYYADLESTNPCVTSDTWVQTASGPLQVKDLVNVPRGFPLQVIVDGKAHHTEGFFQTGIKEVFEVKTERGYSFKATADHKVLTVDKRGERTWKQVASLNLGEDRIVVHNHSHSEFQTWGGKGSRADGWLIGSLFGDGNITKDGTANLDYWGDDRAFLTRIAITALKEAVGGRADTKGCDQAKYNRCRVSSTNLGEVAESYGLTNGCKVLTDSIEQTSSEFHRGFLSGWFDADGSVQGTAVKGVSVRLSCSDREALIRAQRMLGRLGMVSTVYLRRKAQEREMPDGKGGTKLYSCKAQYELCIARECLQTFATVVGFLDRKKQDKLLSKIDDYGSRGLYAADWSSIVESVTPCGKQPVYDCQVPGVNAFDANGLYVHNCGEIWMQPYSVCCLGAVVLPRFVKMESRAKDPLNRIDWGMLYETVTRGIRFLDNVLTVTHYPIPEVEVESNATRRVGLGVMGVADMLVRLGLRYTSQEALHVVDRVMAYIKHASYDASTYLAVEKGSFPEFNATEFLKSGFAKTLKPSVRAKIKANGMRNCACNTVAPGGTTSLVQGVWGAGEPFLAPSYKRNFRKGDTIESEIVVMPIFKEFVEAGLDVSHFEGADEVSAEQHFEMQLVMQKHVDNSISKTINIRQDKYTPEQLSELYMKYVPQLKGVTIYPEGSRDFTPLERLPNEVGVAHVLANQSTTGMEDNCASGVCGL